MRRSRSAQQKRRHKVNAAQAAMVAVFNELYVKRGDDCTLGDVKSAWHKYGGPESLTESEFMEMLIGFWLEVDGRLPQPIIDLMNQAKGVRGEDNSNDVQELR